MSGEDEAAPAVWMSSSIASGGELLQEDAVARGGYGVLGVHVHVAERGRLDALDGVHHGAEGAEWGEQPVGLFGLAEMDRLDDERLPPDQFRDVRQGTGAGGTGRP